MQEFREEVLGEKPYVDAERAVIVTDVYQKHQNQPRVMLRALMLKEILESDLPIDKIVLYGSKEGNFYLESVQISFIHPYTKEKIIFKK